MSITFNTDILLTRNPTAALQAVTKQYVDNSLAAIVTSALIDGGSATTSHSGLLTIDLGKAT